MSNERLCILCPVYRRDPTPVERPMVCESCRERLRTDLTEVPELVAASLGRIEREQTGAEKVSGSREAPVPLNLIALGVTEPPYERGPRRKWMLSPQSDPEDQHGLTPPIVTLDHWVTDWIDTRDQREHQPEAHLSSIVAWLLNRLEWALDEHLVVDEFAADVKTMVRKLRGIVREHHSMASAGRCPSKLRDDSRCNARLEVDPYVDEIQCGRCGTKWTRRDQGWIRLRAQQDEWDSETEEAA